MSVFVDTNVWVYARDASVVLKQPLAGEWLAALLQSREGRISTRVMSEYDVTVTQRLDPGLGRDEAWADLANLQAWQPRGVDLGLLAAAWKLQSRFDHSCWDALIVAAARACRCSHLLTENLQHGHALDEIQVMRPFRVTPEEVLAEELTRQRRDPCCSRRALLRLGDRRDGEEGAASTSSGASASSWVLPPKVTRGGASVSVSGMGAPPQGG